MSTYVAGPGLPFVLEYPSDSKGVVVDYYRDAMQRGRVLTFPVDMGPGSGAPTMLVNFAHVRGVTVANEDLYGDSELPRVHAWLSTDE